ncbi:MAG: hypothetical protein Q8P52_02650 [bacterium]|nr:hypothetical protein [bacterium]
MSLEVAKFRCPTSRNSACRSGLRKQTASFLYRGSLPKFHRILHRQQSCRGRMRGEFKNIFLVPITNYGSVAKTTLFRRMLPRLRGCVLYGLPYNNHMFKFIHKKHMQDSNKDAKIVIYYNASDIFLGFTLLILVVFFINDYLSHRVGSKYYDDTVIEGEISDDFLEYEYLYE